MADRIASVGGRVIIGLKAPETQNGVDESGRALLEPTTDAAGKAAIKSLGGAFLYEFKRQPAVVALLPAGVDVITSLRRNPLIDYVEPEVRGEVLSQTTPWNVAKVQAPAAWSRSTGNGVKVLIIDTGVGPHQDLDVKVAYRCVNGALPVDDVRGHGTAVAGAAAALNNSIDVVGVGHRLSLWSANATDSSGAYITSPEVACAIDVARVNGVFAVNMSFFLSPTTAVTDAIRGAVNQSGMFMVAAAGNNGQLSGVIDYPATLAEVVAVAAVDSFNVRAFYSSYGSKIELAAPAEVVTTTALPGMAVCPAVAFGTTGPCNGTSLASPHVAAAAAILKSYNSSWTNVQIRDRLACAALYIGDPTYYGNGLLQINDAIDGVCQ